MFTQTTGSGFANVLFYFSEIAKIPHGSGNTAQLEQYCLDLAARHGLRSCHAPCGNVMIFKDGTEGYEQSAPLILQGHLDMVCEKLPECQKDMEKESVSLILDGDLLRADGTTLGGDDGIAVAYILALLTSDDIPHPPIEALLTVDEETGLKGAYGLDPSCLKGKRLINIDSEDEGILTVSCAGGARIDCKIPVTMVPVGAICAKKITAGGLLGGHSGIDIHKGRKNALKLLGNLLSGLSKKIQIRIADIAGGGRLNVITSFAEAVVCLDNDSADDLNTIIAAFNDMLKEECAETDPGVYISAETVTSPAGCADAVSTARIISALMQAPYGVCAMDPDIPYLVRTSANPGEAALDNGIFNLNFMIRSNADAEKAALINSVRLLMASVGGTCTLNDDYPAWEYRPVSPLRDAMIKVYEEMYGKRPTVTTIHAGLECGIFAGKLPGADMVSIGPTMKNVHTPHEYLDLRSAERVWDYLLQVLKALN